MKIRADVEGGAGFIWHCEWDSDNPPTIVVGGRSSETTPGELEIRVVPDPMQDESTMSFVETMLHDLTFIQGDSAWVFNASVDGVELSQEWVDEKVNGEDG